MAGMILTMEEMILGPEMITEAVLRVVNMTVAETMDQAETEAHAVTEVAVDAVKT
jgi:hypothetical protein